MERQRRKATWFATLRRDGRLFAVLALALVAIQALQPLAAARASEATGHLVICTALGAEPSSGAPAAREGCSACILGACSSAPAGKAVAASLPAWQPLAILVDARQPVRVAEPRPALDLSAPPGIRAPPSAV